MAEFPAVDTIARFDLATHLSSSEVVVAVRGEVDVLTAPLLGAVLGALVDQGRTDLVVDLADVAFMDAAGLGVIVGTVARLEPLEGRFGIRSPAAIVRRILEIAALEVRIDPDDPLARGAGLGAEQSVGDGSRVVPSASARFAAATTTPAPMIGSTAATAVIDAALRLVTALTQATVGAADGVSVSLTRDGHLATVAATDDTVAQMDRDQYASGEGPCLAAAAEGRWFHVESLVQEDRWPTFVARALDGGIGSILSTPLVVASQPVGALNIYSRATQAFGPQDQELAALFATQASTILAEGLQPDRMAASASRLRAALEGRTVIAQAQGVVMARQGVSAERAFALLLHAAKTTGVPVRQRAEALVAGTVRGGLIGEVPT